MRSAAARNRVQVGIRSGGKNLKRALETLRAAEYQKTGMCGVCLRDIEAQQPGGLNCRHIEDQTPICRTSQELSKQ